MCVLSRAEPADQAHNPPLAPDSRLRQPRKFRVKEEGQFSMEPIQPILIIRSIRIIFHGPDSYKLGRQITMGGPKCQGDFDHTIMRIIAF